MPDIIIDTTRLLSRIVLSQELTALEKRYLEGLVKAPPRKQGRWIKGMLDGEGYHCSECRVWKRVIVTAHYCPNCGAEMNGGDYHVGQST